LRETLFCPSCLLPTVTITPGDSNYVNRSAFLERFSWIILTTDVRANRHTHNTHSLVCSRHVRANRHTHNTHSLVCSLARFVLTHPQVVAHALTPTYWLFWMYVYRNVGIYLCMHACIYACMYHALHACMHECTHVWMYVWMYVCDTRFKPPLGGALCAWYFRAAS